MPRTTSATSAAAGNPKSSIADPVLSAAPGDPVRIDAPLAELPNAKTRRGLSLLALATVLLGLFVGAIAWLARSGGSVARRLLRVFTLLVLGAVTALVATGVLAQRRAIPTDRSLLLLKVFGGLLVLAALALRGLVAHRVTRTTRRSVLPRAVLLNEAAFAAAAVVVAAVLMAQ